MRFTLIDAVQELNATANAEPTRAVAVKHVTAAEEYLADHFPGFPILPGVFMLEALVQTARVIAEARDGGGPPWVLGSARAIKYGRFVPPGSSVRLEVELVSCEGGVLEFKGLGTVTDPGGGEPATAVSGKFSLRRARLAG